jgi:hypothetical protein
MHEKKEGNMSHGLCSQYRPRFWFLNEKNISRGLGIPSYRGNRESRMVSRANSKSEFQIKNGENLEIGL